MINKKNFLKVFSSLQLAIALFLILAIVITIGTCLPQEPLIGRTALINKLGSQNYKWLSFFGITDIFHSGWYLLLLFLLAINLWVTSFQRVFPGYRKAWHWPTFLKKKPNNSIAEFQACIQSKQWEAFLKVCKKNNWQIKINSQNNSAILRKGAFHRLGASITHIGILFTMLGALISLVFGFNGIIQGIPEDRFIISDKSNSPRSYILVGTSKIFKSPFWLGKSPELEVELGQTTRFDYKNGDPKQWKTDLKFFSNADQKLASGQVSVNRPICFKGIDFYQADWSRILRLNFNEQNIEIKLDKLKNTQAEIAFVSLSSEFGLLFFLPNNTNKLNFISVVGKPKAEVFKEPNKLLESGHLKLLASLASNESVRIGPMKFKFKGVFSKTGIQYKYSPGDLLMIVGMSILVLGVLIAFGAKRVIWALKDEKQIFIIGNTDRAKDLFKAEFDKLIKLS